MKRKYFGILICMLTMVPGVTVLAWQNSDTNPVLVLNSPLSENVTIVDYSYNPATITVSVGTKVIWTNNGPSAHTVTSDTGLFDSGNMGVGQKWNYTFDTAGTYKYHCTYHSSMKGTVIVTAPNQPPNTPTTPSGPGTLNVGQSGMYSTMATDPNGDQVQYRFDFDANGAHAYSAYTPLVPSGQTGSMSYIWNTSGTYVVKSQARDSFGLTSNWSNGMTVVVSAANRPPSTPTVSGPSTVTKGISAEFIATTTDPDGDMIQYYFDFGDGTNSGWTAMVNSGTSAHVNHTWANKGTYIVKAKARDTSGAESAYGSLSIKVPFSFTAPFELTFLRIIFDRLARIFPLLGEFLQF
jgi:plastocyanin